MPPNNRRRLQFVFFSFLFIFCGFVFSQNTSEDIYNYPNSVNYAEYLVKTKQYSLAVPELERVYFMNPENDSVKLFLIQSYRKSGANERGILRASEIFPEINSMNIAAALEYSRMLILEKKFEHANLLEEKNQYLLPKDKFFIALNIELFSMKWKNANKIFDEQPEEIKNYFSHYNPLLEQANSMRYKSPFLAAGMSAIIPGTGKLYTKNWKDALLAFIAVGSSAFQSYRGFSKNGLNSAYGWIFGTLAFGFYTGNIYGAHKAAKIYNAKLDRSIYKQAEELFTAD